jgi:spore germination protein
LKRLFVASLFVIVALSATASEEAPARLEFAEVWAYLMDGEEQFFSPSQPITDLGYFGAGLGVSGNLVGVPNRGKLPPFGGRVHLVVAEIGNYALTHFCLDPEYPLRDALIADIVKGAEAFDGVQIDFEAVSSRDYENFYAFLALLKNGLGVKALSVALGARTTDKGDYLDYERIGKIADRIIVMAYDEHWSGSAPGPVASIEWGQKIAAYALSKVAVEKLVMGAPFYGRAWADKSPSRAYKYSSLMKLIEEKGIVTLQRQGDIPFLEYEERVSVKVFYEDCASILSRLSVYRAASVRNIAFWRLGQEDPGVWSAIASPASPVADLSKPPYMVP